MILLLALAQFTNVAEDAGLAKARGWRVTWADVDADGRPDAVLENRFVYLNKNGRFEAKADAGLPEDAHTLIFGDVDNDGDPDAFVGRYCDFDRPRVKDGKVVVDDKGKPVMDVPDDGRRSQIYLNDGAGRFAVKKESGVEEPHGTINPAMFFDYDNDGRLDLMVGFWYKAPWVPGHHGPCYPNALFRGRGDGTFEDVTEKAGLKTRPETERRDGARPTFGLSHADWNNDGFQDVFVCVYGRQWNYHYKNNGDGTFTEVGEKTKFDGDDDETGVYTDEVKKMFAKRGNALTDEEPWRSNGNTFDAACADFDNDGDIDVFLCEITHWWAGPPSDPSMLLVNQGAPDFAFHRDLKRGIDRGIDKESAKNWNEGDLRAGWLDVDHDGLLDLLLASGDYPDGQFLRIYRQKDDHNFTDATKALGLDWESCGGLSLADYDRDGDVDILVGRSLMRAEQPLLDKCPKGDDGKPMPVCALWRSDASKAGKSISIRLVGKTANRQAIGARVKVGPQTREIYGSLGHNGHQDYPELVFGLGDAPKADVEIRWPNAKLTVTKHALDAGRYVIAEDGKVTKE